MKIGLYLRVSTSKQETENQALDLRTFADRQAWMIFREYVDFETGSTSDRQAFRQMFEDASKRRFDLVLFWALDRFSREGVYETLQHLNRLESYGVGFRSYTEPYFDSCGVFKDAVIAILATLAKQERIQRSQRTKAGLARARAAGRILGRPKKIYSYQGEAMRLRESGKSFRAISRELGISEFSVRRLVLGERLLDGDGKVRLSE